MFKMVAAVAPGGVIGRDGTIPWDLPEDRRMFKELTMGGTLIVGRKTYESIGGPLPGRDTIVVTSHGSEILGTAAGSDVVAAARGGTVRVAKDLKQAMRMAGEQDAFFCGGERIYEEGLPFTDILYLTKVEMPVEGDTFFPADYEKPFKLIDRTRLSAACTLLTYVRR